MSTPNQGVTEMTSNEPIPTTCTCGHRVDFHSTRGCHVYVWEAGIGQTICSCPHPPVRLCVDTTCALCRGSGEYPTGAGYTRGWVPHLLPMPDPTWAVV